MLLPEYLRYWGLVRVPFSLAPDPAMIYMSRQHQECLLRLQYAIFSNKGGALLISENAGDGKTSILTHLKKELESERGGGCRVAFISHPTLSAIQILQEISRQLGITDPPEDKLQLLNGLRNFLTQLQQEGIPCIVAIDEGQMLAHRPDILQELRILLNLTLAEAFLFTLIFSGQKPLEGVIRAMPEFWQRLPVRYFLGNLDQEDTHGLIRHRLRVAGSDPSRELFTPEAAVTIYRFSEGVPRVICSVADLSLLIGHSQRVRTIGPMEVTRACADMDRTGGDGFHYYHFLRNAEDGDNPISLRERRRPAPAAAAPNSAQEAVATGAPRSSPPAGPDLEPAPAAWPAPVGQPPGAGPAAPTHSAAPPRRSYNPPVDEAVLAQGTTPCGVCGHELGSGARICPACRSPFAPLLDPADWRFLRYISRLPDALRCIPSDADLSRVRLVAGETLLMFHLHIPINRCAFSVEVGCSPQERCGLALTSQSLHLLFAGRSETIGYKQMTARTQRHGRTGLFRKVSQVRFQHGTLAYRLWLHFPYAQATQLARGIVELLIHKAEL